MELVKLYRERVKAYKIECVEDLERLADEDYRKLFFTLVYYYLNDEDLSKFNLRTNYKLLYAISHFCSCLNCEDVSEYYKQYLDIEEMKVQISKLQKEINICEKVEELKKVWDVK